MLDFLKYVIYVDTRAQKPFNSMLDFQVEEALLLLLRRGWTFNSMLDFHGQMFLDYNVVVRDFQFYVRFSQREMKAALKRAKLNLSILC